MSAIGARNLSLLCIDTERPVCHSCDSGMKVLSQGAEDRQKHASVSYSQAVLTLSLGRHRQQRQTRDNQVNQKE